MTGGGQPEGGLAAQKSRSRKSGFRVGQPRGGIDNGARRPVETGGHVPRDVGQPAAGWGRQCRRIAKNEPPDTTSLRFERNLAGRGLRRFVPGELQLEIVATEPVVQTTCD